MIPNVAGPLFVVFGLGLMCCFGFWVYIGSRDYVPLNVLGLGLKAYMNLQ